MKAWEGHDFGQVTQENPDGTVSLAYGSDSKVLLIDDADAFLRRHWEIVHSGECLVVDTFPGPPRAAKGRAA